MLNAHEIYVLGKNAVDENRNNYYSGMGSDIIAKHPERFVSHIDAMIARLERVKSFAVDYQKTLEEEEKDEPEW